MNLRVSAFAGTDDAKTAAVVAEVKAALSDLKAQADARAEMRPEQSGPVAAAMNRVAAVLRASEEEPQAVPEAATAGEVKGWL